jgi:hypothetical protein
MSEPLRPYRGGTFASWNAGHKSFFKNPTSRSCCPAARSVSTYRLFEPDVAAVVSNVIFGSADTELDDLRPIISPSSRSSR